MILLLDFVCLYVFDEIPSRVVSVQFTGEVSAPCSFSL